MDSMKEQDNGGQREEEQQQQEESSAQPVAAARPTLSFRINTTQATAKRQEVRRTLLAAQDGRVMAEVDEEEEEVRTKTMRNLIIEDGVLIEEKSKEEKAKAGKSATATGKKSSLVIPPQRAVSDWRVERLKKIISEGGATDEDRARLTLLIEALGERDVVMEETMLDSQGNEMTLKVEEQAQMMEQVMVATTVEEADYEAVPIEEFGLAFLRGWGFNEDEGIGRTNRRVVPLKVTQPRPKGLGLGADTAVAKKQDERKKKAGDDSGTSGGGGVKRGSRVCVLAGAERGSVGVVRSLDEDNSACFVEMAISGKIVRVNQYNLELLGDNDGERGSNGMGAGSRSPQRRENRRELRDSYYPDDYSTRVAESRREKPRESQPRRNDDDSGGARWRGTRDYEDGEGSRRRREGRDYEDDGDRRGGGSSKRRREGSGYNNDDERGDGGEERYGKERRRERRSSPSATTGGGYDRGYSSSSAHRHFSSKKSGESRH